MVSAPRGSNHKQTYREVRVMAASSLLAEIRASKKPYYVYVLSKPDGKPFYVGMGKGERVFRHEREAKAKTGKSRRLNTIRKIWRNGGEVQKSIESWHDTKESACRREVFLIGEFGRIDIGTGTLANLSAGGESPEMGPEARKNNREAKRLFFARHPEARKKMSGVMSRRWKENPSGIIARIMDGKSTESFRLKMARVAKALKARYDDPAVRACKADEARAWIEANKEQAIDNQRKSRAVMRSDQMRRECSDRMRRYANTPENRAINSARTKQWFRNNPDAAKEIAKRRAAAHGLRKRTRHRCLRLARRIGIEGMLPNGRSSLATWQALETKLRERGRV